MDIHSLTITKINAGLQRNDFSATELTQAYLERIHLCNPTLNAFLTITDDAAHTAAEDIDQRIARKDPIPPLMGVPGAIKDVIVTKGIRTTAGSKMLAHYIPPYDATTVEMLKKQGYILMGKTNCDEFAMGASNENSAFGPTKNPWDITRVSGGSSGGSAAAVAAGLVPFALGSDTGGSIRQPASLCGIVGLHPTYGRVSRYGLIAMAASLDQIGVLSKTVEDAETVFNVIQGHDTRDATSVINLPDYTIPIEKSLNGLKIGIPIEYVGKNWDAVGIEQGVKTCLQEAISLLEARGAKVTMISLPHASHALATYYIIAPSEVSSNLARFDGIRYGGTHPIPTGNDLIDWYEEVRERGLGPEPMRRIIIGTYVLSSGYRDTYYKKALQMRVLIREDFAQAFSEVDLIACPTSPTVAFKLGSKTNDPLAMYLADIFTVANNVAGLPGMSLPCGFASAPDDPAARLPVGLQLIAPAFGESSLFRVGKFYQSITAHHLVVPHS